MTPDAALDALRAQVEPGRAEQMIAYHKQSRTVLGVGNEVLNTLSRDWRGQLDLEARVVLAAGLWTSDIFEARILAAKLLTQARIKPDTAVWDLVQTWVPDFDSWAIADHAASAISKRLQADPARLDVVEGWTTSDHMWSRRAALVSTLPWAKLSNPKPADLDTRERILGWAATYVQDRDWFIQKAIGWWLRDLSKHDADRTRAFLAGHGGQMKAFARKEAVKYLK
ncbi:DNA alkylation repair protein [Tritonibacter mobilis]|uniref:DNA alkylation repair protein n=1 Tax=Tritonibacter mobilis TaxID=379347 RepID=UPI001CDA013A|nr:DNA alkylation repair protein [Tritonibacter mobilis]MCA2008443.1 DNA alkylation repair protein [Tritonibacter mobilis]